MENQLAISSEMQLAITEQAQIRNALVAFTGSILKKDQDFGIIPGVSKPSLLKPGAEKLLSFYQLSAEFDCTDKMFDIPSKFIAYTYKATIKNRDGRILTQCEGSVNSYESKYRYTWVESSKRPEKAEADLLKSQGLGKYKQKNGQWVWTERVENPDLVGLQNTIQKMAQKRAFVGAILLATGASEFFTQDVEDMGFIDVDSTVVDEPKKDEPKQVEEPTEDEKVSSFLKKPINKEEKSLTEVPEETLQAIKEAGELKDLAKIYNDCTNLHTNSSFTQALAERKSQIKTQQAA